MSSIRESIIQAVVTALTGSTPAAGQVFRERVEPFTRGELPAIDVLPEEETDQLQSDTINESTLTLHIIIHTRGEMPFQLADPVAVAAHAVLMSNAALLALVFQIKKDGSKWERDEADQTAGMLTTTYRLRYLHPVADLATTI